MRLINPRQAGDALLSALLMMVLMAMTAMAIFDRLRIDIVRTSQLIEMDRRYLASQAVRAWAITQLQTESQVLLAKDETGLLASFPEKGHAIYPGVVVRGSLYDLQSRINLNNLTIPFYRKILQSLLKERAPQMNQALIKAVTAATVDWISPEIGAGQDAWGGYYTSMRPPYQAAHQAFASPSELKLVAGVTPEIIKLLSPYVTALPEVTALNINTVSPAVLKAMNPDLTKAALEPLFFLREQGGIRTVGVLNTLSNKLGLTMMILGIQSQYFLSIATVEQGHKTLTVYTVLRRLERKPNEWDVTVVRESFNVL